ncbi:MAG: LuxR C-terminal-related transcriptional regulator [Sulfuricaulis sp.]|nr:LuxR C-terminal-related transcriptional regulator [Sulfuricaulis sp.]
MVNSSTIAETLVRRAKLVAPSSTLRSVNRKGIAELVARSADAKLVLFRAPAGFGKTTAMRQYLHHLQSTNTAVAWLTLDPLDDDFRRFLIHLISAFDPVLKQQEANKQNPDIPSAFENVDQLAFDLIDRIADCAHRFTFFIDDFETVSNHSIDDFLRVILQRLPPGGQLAIASREAPNLQLGRLRAHGQLVEVDQLRLRFSHAETDAFLRTQHGLPLSKEDVTKLQGDTEGWPAALWLAATALEKREHPESFIATFSGSNAAVAEYLAEDVLSQQAEDVQQFLLKTSILSELNKPLCDALCERDDSETVLNRLEHSNVCVTMLDSERQLYRYHGLFAGFLRNQLNQLYSHEIAGLHLTAARWYQSEGRPIPAIEHALASGDVSYALPLLVSHADSLLFQGRFRLLARWLDTLSQKALWANPDLRIAHIWTLTFTGRGMEALRHLEAIDSDHSAGESAGGEQLASEIAVLRPFILAVLDRHEEAYLLAEETFLKKPPQNKFSYRVLTTLLATFRLAANRHDDAIELLKIYSGDSDDGRTSFPTVYAICTEGLVDLTQGRVRQAIAHFRVALSDAAASYGSRSIGKSIAAIYLAESLYEVDELEEAEQLLALSMPIAREYGMPDLVIVCHVIQSRIAYHRGDVDHAFRLLSELEYFGRKSNLPRVLAAVQLERARLALLRGDVAEAENHFLRASNPQAWSSIQRMIMLANDVETVDLCQYRLYLHGVGKMDVVNAIKESIKHAQACKRDRRSLKLRILLAKALHATGENRLSMRMVEDVLQIACRDGMVRTFLDEGAPIIELLRDFRVARSLSAESGQDNDLISFLDRILRRAGVNVEDVSLEDAAMGASIVLSSRELQILKLLSLGLSNIAIADKIFVSETTVRAHLRKINVKLGAGNRTQAVSLARRLGLIK